MSDPRSIAAPRVEAGTWLVLGFDGLVQDVAAEGVELGGEVQPELGLQPA